MPEEMTPPELAVLAAALGALTPAPAAVDRDRLMFEAGRASVARSRLWPALAAAGLLLATALGTLLAVRPAVERIVHVQVDRPPSEPRPALPLERREAREPQSTYWQLHVFVMERDIDEWPPPPPVPLAPRSMDDL